MLLLWAFFIIASAGPSMPLTFQGRARAKAASIDRPESKGFFVTEALPVHLGPAADILTQEFYSHRTNFVTYQIERLKTVLSLESTYPNRSGPEYSSARPLQSMFVACDSKSGQVLGFAEVDARSLNDSTEYDDILRSYMYNLAVKKTHKRRGIAKALVRACEIFVSEMHETCVEKRLYLRVRASNTAGVMLYTSLGYEFMDPESISLTSHDINKGSQENGELILFAKDLELEIECMI